LQLNWDFNFLYSFINSPTWVFPRLQWLRSFPIKIGTAFNRCEIFCSMLSIFCNPRIMILNPSVYHTFESKIHLIFQANVFPFYGTHLGAVLFSNITQGILGEETIYLNFTNIDFVIRNHIHFNWIYSTFLNNISWSVYPRLKST
jgi:hypothetical protein